MRYINSRFTYLLTYLQLNSCTADRHNTGCLYMPTFRNKLKTLIFRDGIEPSLYGFGSVRVLWLPGFGSVRVLGNARFGWVILLYGEWRRPTWLDASRAAVWWTWPNIGVRSLMASPHALTTKLPKTATNCCRNNLNLLQFTVIEGYRFWDQSKAHMRLPISQQ